MLFYAWFDFPPKYSCTFCEPQVFIFSHFEWKHVIPVETLRFGLIGIAISSVARILVGGGGYSDDKEACPSGSLKWNLKFGSLKWHFLHLRALLSKICRFEIPFLTVYLFRMFRGGPWPHALPKYTAGCYGELLTLPSESSCSSSVSLSSFSRSSSLSNLGEKIVLKSPNSGHESCCCFISLLSCGTPCSISNLCSMIALKSFNPGHSLELSSDFWLGESSWEWSSNGEEMGSRKPSLFLSSCLEDILWFCSQYGLISSVCDSHVELSSELWLMSNKSFPFPENTTAVLY